MEVSAKECINVSEAFYELVRLIQEKEGKITLDTANVHIYGGSWVLTLWHGLEYSGLSE